MPAIRGKVMSLMRVAIKAGQSRTSFFKSMAKEKLTYTRKNMVADWSFLVDVHVKTGALAKVGRDAYPGAKTVITTDWDIAAEFLYVVKVKSRLSPDVPVTERNVNIVSDIPLTPRMIEQAVVEKWSEWEDYTAEAIEKITPFTAIRTTI